MSKGQKKEYLTTERLRSWTNQAFDKASDEAMEVAGHVVRVEEEWIVKEFADGSIEKIKPLEAIDLPEELLFD